jgi:hydrogenase nickel incorporation protein HypA/HybF
MHEAPIAQALFDAAIAALPDHGTRITKFHVKAGPFAGVDPECLRFYMTELSRNTPAEGAELIVDPAPARLTCQACGNAEDCHSPSSVRFTCDKCGSPCTITGGHELYLESIDVE